MKFSIKILLLCLSLGIVNVLTFGQSAIAAEEGGDPPPPLDPIPLIPPTPLNEYLPRDPGNVLVFPNVKVNQDVGNAPQNETTIAINPVAGDQYVAGANDYRSGVDSRCGFYYSTDSAQTWHDGSAVTAGLLPLQPGYGAAGDPSVAFDNAGKAYFACMNFNRSNQNTGMYVFSSTDGGQTYGVPALVTAGIGPTDFHDKEYIATDKFTNSVYMSWTHFIPGASPILFAGSPTAPFIFNSPLPKIISNLPDNQGSVPAGGSVANQVYVAWQNFDFPSKIQVTKTNNVNTLANFSAPVTVANITSLPGTLTGEFGSFRVNSFPTMDVCRNSSSPFFGQVYVAWADYRNGDADILFSRSLNGGVTWSAPLRVNDDLLNNHRDQFFPWMSVDQNCKINIAFNDRRDDVFNQRFHLYFTHSTNGGTSFVPNARVSTVASTNAQFGGQFIGDYIGLTSTDGANSIFHHQVPRAVPSWMDTRNGNQDAYAATVLQIGSWANIDLVYDGIFDADDFDLVFTGNLVDRFSSFYESPFNKVSVTYDAGSNQTTVRYYSDTPISLHFGDSVHVGFVATIDPLSVKSFWTREGREIDAFLAPPPPVGAVAFRYNSALKQFSIFFCNKGAPGTDAIDVANLSFAVLDLPLELKVLNAQDFQPALDARGAQLQSLPAPTNPIAPGTCAPPVLLSGTIEPFQAVAVTAAQTFDGGDPINRAVLFDQAVAKATQICDVNGDNQVNRNDINQLMALRNKQAPVGAPSDANGMITTNVARDCVNQCTKPNCAI